MKTREIIAPAVRFGRDIYRMEKIQTKVPFGGKSADLGQSAADVIY